VLRVSATVNATVRFEHARTADGRLYEDECVTLAALQPHPATGQDGARSGAARPSLSTTTATASATAAASAQVAPGAGAAQAAEAAAAAQSVSAAQTAARGEVGAHRRCVECAASLAPYPAAVCSACATVLRERKTSKGKYPGAGGFASHGWNSWLLSPQGPKGQDGTQFPSLKSLGKQLYPPGYHDKDRRGALLPSHTHAHARTRGRARARMRAHLFKILSSCLAGASTGGTG
jgi:hypothetical protein